MTRQSTERASSEAGAGKVPHKAFQHPAEVVTDPALSKDEKRKALEALEQDAKQLATASEEGMGGGEATNLRDVLVAKESLELPPADVAFAVVSQTFEAKLAEAVGTKAHEVIAHAIDSIEAARKAISEMADTAAPPPGAPRPGSERELDEELAKEKLDP